ncbi:MAG: hypothetical protein ABT19_11320 [Rhodanobacter sp. SCN 68-63]|nr:MAG: hypothetical protein ABT19_11320 [Rhodanobacter sp. SCN 68-63]
MHRTVLAGLAALLVLPAYAATPAPSAHQPLDMETIMANPDWIGHPVESPYWSVNGRSIYYHVQRDGSPVRDLYRVDPVTGKSEKLDPAAVAQADGPAVFDRRHTHAAFIRHGDVFVVDLASGRRRQVTRTPEDESSPQFSADGRALQYRQGNDWFTYDLASGVSAPAAVLKFADDPQVEKPDTLRDHQRALFSTLRQLKADKDAERAQEKRAQGRRQGRGAEGDPLRHRLGLHRGQGCAQLRRSQGSDAAVAAAAGSVHARELRARHRGAPRHQGRPAESPAQQGHCRARKGR